MPTPTLFRFAIPLLLGCALAAGPPPLAQGDCRLTLLQTTDLHHHARGPGQLSAAATAEGGYARIAAYVEGVRARAGHPVLLVDSGDWSMGTFYDLTLGRRPLALWFADALRYDCVTFGNHEFDYGPAGLAGMLRAAQRGWGLRTPIVASNLQLCGNADLAPLLGEGRPIRRTVVRTLPGGLRVGFLGLMGRAAAGVAPAAAPVRFTDYSRDYALVQDLVDQLRIGQRCGLVIALDHAGTDADGAGGEDVDLARHVAGIDLIASGHTHIPLGAARTVAFGAWNTLICCAGAYGTHVSRLDLVCRAGGGVTLEASENRPMTDASLAGLGLPGGDPGIAAGVDATDRELNEGLAGVFARVAGFTGDPAVDPARGLYRPVGGCARDLLPEDRTEFLGPSALGNFCADAFRAVPNLRPGADPAPFSVAVAATGELRGGLSACRSISFADLYGILPLGRSPDPSQDDTTGEPLVGAYLEPDGLRELCAVQLLAQAGLAGPDFYLNLSGLAYDLRPAETGSFFGAAGAATALALTSRRAGEGSAQAGQALKALAGLPGDQGAALLAAMAAGNPYAGAMVRLGGPAQVPAGLELLARVAAAARAGGTRLDALLMEQAVAAIGPLRLFAPSDPACTGASAELPPGRCRVVLDYDSLLMVDGTQARFGTRAALYQNARGDDRLTGAPDGLARILANRIPLDPAGPFQELKTWAALVRYLAAPPGQGGHFDRGRIQAEYGASLDFRRFPESGAAVRVRNAGFPLDRLAVLADMARALREAP